MENKQKAAPFLSGCCYGPAGFPTDGRRAGRPGSEAVHSSMPFAFPAFLRPRLGRRAAQPLVARRPLCSGCLCHPLCLSHPAPSLSLPTTELPYRIWTLHLLSVRTALRKRFLGWWLSPGRCRLLHPCTGLNEGERQTSPSGPGPALGCARSCAAGRRQQPPG